MEEVLQVEVYTCGCCVEYLLNDKKISEKFNKP